MKKKIKICFVLVNRANYGRTKILLSKIKRNKRFDVKIVLISSTVLKKYGNLNKVLAKDHLKADYECFTHIEGENLETMTKSSDDNYEFEPDEDEILSNLLPKNISTQIFKAMLENSASEQGSRMSAMDNATRNAGEMVDKLTIQYNRSRQAAITKELIEIISGAESL